MGKFSYSKTGLWTLSFWISGRETMIMRTMYHKMWSKSVWSRIWYLIKGQLISKANCQAVNSSKKRTNEFVFTTMRRVFVRFLEEIEDTKKTFRNYLTFSIYDYLVLNFYYLACFRSFFGRNWRHQNSTTLTTQCAILLHHSPTRMPSSWSHFSV